MIYTGIRVNTIRTLEKEDVNLSEQFFTIDKDKNTTRRATSKREVPIADKILPFMEHWCNKNESKYMFTTRQGNPLTDKNYRDAYWKPIVNDLLALNYTPHATRHTTISLLAKAGVDERITRRIVGHAGKSLTENVYTHFERKQLLDAINKI